MKALRILIFAYLSYIVFFFLEFFALISGLANKSLLMSGLAILVLMIPALIVLAKWYFKSVPPTIREGAILGGFSGVLFLVTVWAFSKFGMGFSANPLLLLVAIEIFIVSIYAGFEFDGTYSKPIEKK